VGSEATAFLPEYSQLKPNHPGSRHVSQLKSRIECGCESPQTALVIREAIPGCLYGSKRKTLLAV
jgi:hypothetical protein